MTEAEVRKEALETELSVAEAPAPRLLPNLGELYRAKVAALQDALEEADAEAVPRAGPRLGRRDPPQSSYADPLRPLQVDVRVRLGREGACVA